ncbi:MAG: chorismate-binding protein [Flavobacteriaceae bacterium]|nr:chorismate-binding protein [Flavobacteriaceae bacterium]
MPDFSTLCKEFENARNLQKPFVVYRKPGTLDVQLFVQKDSSVYRFKTEREAGFIFSPFNVNRAGMFFPSEKCQFFSADYKESDLENCSVGKKVELKITEDFDRREQYLTLVSHCLDFMRRTGTRKIVLSRKEEVQISGLPVVCILRNLLENYPDAFVYIWYHPSVGMWAGASPETLLSVEKDQFKTMALAGTQRIKGDKELVWGQKEKEEQQIVTDYIKNELGGLITRISPAKTIRGRTGCSYLYRVGRDINERFWTESN